MIQTSKISYNKGNHSINKILLNYFILIQIRPLTFIFLFSQIKYYNEFKDLKDCLIIGGGLNKESIDELERLGIKKVLVGTSLHSGEISII